MIRGLTAGARTSPGQDYDTWNADTAESHFNATSTNGEIKKTTSKVSPSGVTKKSRRTVLFCEARTHH